MYTLIGYDKDYDVYDILSTHPSLAEAETAAEEIKYSSLVPGTVYRSSAGDPYDWLEIYTGYNTTAEKRVRVIAL